jgi:uncharacterized protein YjbI with pentapeptide repeats
MRKKKQTMSTVSQIPSSSSEADGFRLPAETESLDGVLARTREDLVPADQLPSAVSALAELFPPEGDAAPDSAAGAALRSSVVATEDSSALSLAHALTDEPHAGEHLAAVEGAVEGDFPAEAQRDFQESPRNILIEDGIPGGSAPADAVIADALQDAAAPPASLETDSERSGARNENRRKRSAFSGISAAKKGLLRNILAVFKGPAKNDVGSSQAPNTSDAVEAAARPQEVAMEAEVQVRDQSASAAIFGKGETTLPEQALALAAEPSNVEISGADRVEDPASIFPQAADSLHGRELTVSANEGLDSRARDTAQREDVAFQQSIDEFAAEASPSGDSSDAEPIFEDEDQIVDASDDDHAIASAIERYANLTDPDRAKALEPAQNTAPLLPEQELPGERDDLNVILGIPRDLTPADSVLGYVVPSVQIPDSGEVPVSIDAAASSGFQQTAASDTPPEAVAQELPDVVAPVPAPATSVSPRDWSFEEKLASHHEWIESKGTSGKRIDFASADLEGNDLIGANLRYMDLHDANLRAADLLMADLRDTCLVRANFRDSCLVGANLEAANLEGASLETSMGLVPHQLAGANLHEATLPPHILQFEALSEFKRASRTVHGYFVAMMSLSALSWLIIWMTKDFQLLTNSAILPFLHSPAAAAALPTVQFYLIAPFALFILYLVFHFHLQHLWDTVLELPAVFPDGRALGENQPRIVVGLLRTHFRWMNQDAPSTRVIEKASSIFVAYWIVPATLLFYWLRYLTLQEMHGSILQEFLVVGAAGAALYSTTKVGRPAANWMLQESIVERAFGKLRDVSPVKTALVLLGALTFISAGTMVGVPHGKERAPQFWAGSIRRWAPAVLWSFGIDPYADLTEAVISTKPANWNGSDEQVGAVKGARLNDSNFRYAQGYRVFLANAHLLHAKFQGAFLSQADLRSADLGQGDLRYAILDQAQMNHANLDRAVLDGANLSRSDLRAANLSYASLAGATLVDARVDGATLYGAKLPAATMIRANFEKADLRESHLDGANLEHGDMQGAYLWSAKLPGAHLNNAQLGAAIFVDADLRGADLRWAQLPGTVLTGADLTGALLDGADFRGAVGFGANQICSAKSRRGLLLDGAMQAQVTTQCGAAN